MSVWPAVPLAAAVRGPAARSMRSPVLDKTVLATIIYMAAVSGACAHSADDKLFANAALGALHRVAAASREIEIAAKDGDRLGCEEANKSLQVAAHDAFTNMHEMSSPPFDAVDRLSAVLRTGSLTSEGCSSDSATEYRLLPILAGQAISGLRVDYAVGDAGWYSVDNSDRIKIENPVAYAQSLIIKHFSWVDLRPKGVLFLGALDWKSEFASHEVDDPAIEHSGSRLKAVEVGYREKYGDENTTIYFFRTEDAARVFLAAREAEKLRKENEVRLSAQIVPTLTSIPYLIVNKDTGFKLVYSVCKEKGKNANGEHECRDDDSHDWSDDAAVPYHFFSDRGGCLQAGGVLYQGNSRPADVNIAPDDFFSVDCVRASEVSGRLIKGYRATLALSIMAPEGFDRLYVDLRAVGATNAIVFKNFTSCYEAADKAYSDVMRRLDVEVELVGNCLRVY